MFALKKLSNQPSFLGMLFVLLSVVAAFSFSAAGYAAANANSSPIAIAGSPLLNKVQHDTYLANRAFRHEQLAETRYKKELRLNPRQVYLLHHWSRVRAEEYFRAAIHVLRQIERAGGKVPGRLKAELLASYAWFEYPASRLMPWEPLGAADHARIFGLLKQAVGADPTYASAWICLAYLDLSDMNAHGKKHSVIIARFEADTNRALVLAPGSPNALFLRASCLRLSGGAATKVCNLYYLAAKNLPKFSLRLVRYDLGAYDGITQDAQLYLQRHRTEPYATKAADMLPPLRPLPKGIVVHQFPPAGGGQ